MKKRFLQIATAISAATMLAACSQTDLIDDGSVKNNGTADNNAVTFSTYTSKKGGTRAGESGNMDKVKLQGTGFGVFAYHTYDSEHLTDTTYNSYQKFTDDSKKPGAGAHAPNFMYNQLVYFSETGESWNYTPLKYWPNDFNAGAVDSVAPPKSPAQGSGHYGNVSFFAYAPYVEVTNPGEEANYANITETNKSTGITKVTSNAKTGDPEITYTLGQDYTETSGDDGTTKTYNGKYVDLLWGTLAEATTDTINTDIFGNKYKGVTGSEESGTTAYEKAILDGYTVAADLTKQKVNGQIKFNFVHALAGIGGSSDATPGKEPEQPGTEDDVKHSSSGFRVVLDIDNSDKGSTTHQTFGGTREKFGRNNEYYRTVVTISEVKISNVNDINTGVKNSDGTDRTDSSEGSSKLYSKGTLDLATGQWEIDGTSSEFNFEQTVDGSTSGTNSNESNIDKTHYELNPAIAESYNGASYFDTYTAKGTDNFSKTNVLNYFSKDIKISTLLSDDDDDASIVHTGVIAKSQLNVYKDADVSPILLIPGSTPIFQIKVKYIVRQYDAALSSTYTEVTNVITKNVQLPTIELNKHYSLIMHLGLTSVKFTAVVDNWTEYTEEPSNPTPNPGGTEGTEPDKKPTDNNGVEVDLPSNEVYKTTE